MKSVQIDLQSRRKIIPSYVDESSVGKVIGDGGIKRDGAIEGVRGPVEGNEKDE